MKFNCLHIYKLFLLILFLPLILFGQEKDSIEIKLNYISIEKPPKSLVPYKVIERPRIGLAFSGGGARCICQIGVLQVLEENDIPIDFIVGTSMGSVIGGLYAAGYSPQEIIKFLNSINWEQIIIDTPPRSTLFLGQKQDRERYLLQLRFSSFKPYIPSGLTPGQTIANILTDFTMKAPYNTATDFNELRIPFRAVTTDLISGNKILLRKGNLADVMCASLAFPLLFTPVRWDSMLLVDGGLINNIPVSETKEIGADIVIAVDATSNLRSEQNILLPWEVVDQATSIMQREKNAQQRELADILLRFEQDDRLSGNFKALESSVENGRKITLEKLDDIKRMIYEKSFTPDDCDSIQTEIAYRFDSIQIRGLKNLSSDYLNPWLQTIKSTKISYQSLKSKLAELYSTGYFKDVWGEIFFNTKDTLLIVEVVENPLLLDIFIEGNSIFPDSVLVPLFSNKVGNIINHKTGTQDLQRLIRIYRQSGYSLAEINQVILDEFNILHIRLDEGKIGKINLEGNEHTRDFVIMCEFPLKQGDIFNLDAAKTGIKNIYGTGLFNTVRLNIIRRNGIAEIIIKLNEKDFDLLRIGGRYDRERLGRSFIELVADNIMGTAHKFTFHAQYGEKDELFRTGFRADRLVNTYFTYNLDLFYKRSKYNIYNFNTKIGEYVTSRTGLNLSVGRQMRRFGTLSIEGKINHVKLRSLQGNSFPNQELDLKILRIGSIVDTQDQFPYPNEGKYHQFYYEVSSAKILTSEQSYFKLFSSLETYSTFFTYHTFHPKLVWGTSDLTTPYSEQYRLGGMDNFYGLREHQMIGRHLMAASIEYRFKLPKKFVFNTYFHIIGGMAGIWAKEVDIKPKDFIYSLGLKVSTLTPIGPIAFAYGRVNDGRSRFYFSIGHAF